MWRRLAFVALFCVSSARALADPPNEQPQVSIWYEARLGHVLAGPVQSPHDRFLAYGYYFAAIGPTPSHETKRYGDCLEDAVKETAAKYRTQIVNNAATFPDEATYDPKQIDRTNQALSTARGNYTAAIHKWCRNARASVRKYIDGTSLGLVRRECADRFCLDVPVVKKASERDEGWRRERTFEATHYWLVRSNLDLAPDLVIKLAYAPAGGGLSSTTVEVKPAANWPKPLPDDERFRRFEERAARIYRKRDVPRMSATIVAQVRVPKATVLRIAGAFDDAQSAYALASDLPELSLMALQDEVARVRLTECRDFRGKPSLPDIASCAGYQIDEKQLLDCVNGDACMPQHMAQADVGALLVGARTSVSDLAKAAVLPRPYSDAIGGYKKLAEDAKTCAASLSLASVSTDQLRAEDKDKITACVGKLQIDEGVKNRVSCALQRQKADTLLCALDGEDLKLAEAFRDCSRAQRQNCVIEAALPPDLACIGKATKLGDLTCVGPIGNAAKTAQCLQDNASDYAGKIRCVAGTQVTGPAKDLLDCYTPAASKADIALCAAGKSLPPKQAQMLKCAAESGGNYVSAGVCMAAPNLGLNTGQQIMLQCAMSTGGEPISFATCTAGQFTFRELMGCRAAEFGESGCFGDGNEFQRLAKALTGHNISKGSVVGEVVIAHVQAANAAISGIGHALTEAGKGFSNIGEGTKHEIAKLEHDPVGAIADAPGNIARETEKGIENAAHEAGRVIRCGLFGC